MGNLFAKIFKFLLAHPEVVQVVVNAIETHKEKD